MFSGIGGFELGIERAYDNRPNVWNRITDLREDLSNTPESPTRATCVGYSEIDKYAVQIYEKHFKHTNYGDATSIDPSTIEDFDLLVGGFPCQAFSIAGKRAGFNDTRGTLFFDIARILREKRPKHFVLENVKGLLSHDDGRTFKTIISTLVELGYGVEWQVLNSKNHGVPQNRERVFIVGHLGRCCGRQVFPIGQDDREASGLPRHVSNTLTARYEGAQATGTYIGESELNASEIQQVNRPVHSNDRVYSESGIGPTLNTMQGGNRQPFVHQRARGKNPGGMHTIAPTMSSHSWQDNNTVDAVRRLTPIECERLQAFPDQWTEGVSDSQRYKCLGNAVTVNVVSEVVSRLLN